MTPNTVATLSSILGIEEGTGPKKNGRYLPYDDKTGKQLDAGMALQGKLTIGTGRNLTDRGISEDERLLMLQNDLRDNERECFEDFAWFQALDVPRQIAIMDITFNMGTSNFKAKFPNTIQMMEQGHWGAVASALRGSLWHKQVGERADHIIRILETGLL